MPCWLKSEVRDVRDEFRPVPTVDKSHTLAYWNCDSCSKSCATWRFAACVNCADNLMRAASEACLSLRSSSYCIKTFTNNVTERKTESRLRMAASMLYATVEIHTRLEPRDIWPRDLRSQCVLHFPQISVSMPRGRIWWGHLRRRQLAIEFPRHFISIVRWWRWCLCRCSGW